MNESEVTIRIRPAGPAIAVIDVAGRLTAAAETALMDAFEVAGDEGARVILLGFDHLAYMNSAGIGLLVRLVVRARRQAQQVMAYGLKEHFRRIFELTRLQEVIAVYDSESEALNTLLAVGD